MWRDHPPSQQLETADVTQLEQYLNLLYTPASRLDTKTIQTIEHGLLIIYRRARRTINNSTIVQHLANAYDRASTAASNSKNKNRSIEVAQDLRKAAESIEDALDENRFS
ncbi:MAG: hypothetical protein QNJ45_16195 [Ardenticatenaceae bacterium]|nr:hypothetical protein [Ardenticatenaceae bacterium]